MKPVEVLRNALLHGDKAAVELAVSIVGRARIVDLQDEELTALRAIMDKSKGK